MTIAWHVATCWGGHEERVFDKLIDLHIPTVWLRYSETRRFFHGKLIAKPRSFASGYLFVSFDGRDPQHWHNVKDTGVGAFIAPSRSCVI